MGTSVPAVRAFRDGKGAIAAALVVVALLFSPCSLAFAADLTATSGNGLTITGATSHILSEPPTTASAENEWLSGLHISGYLSQQFGMWQNPTALRDYTPSRNNLSVARTLLQVDENYRLNDSNNFFAREWFVYEPPYSFDSANNHAWSVASPNHSSFGHFMNGYYNNYQVRDAWWENKTGPLTLYTGFIPATRLRCGANRWRFAWAMWLTRRILAGPSVSPTSSSRGFRSGWSIRF